MKKNHEYDYLIVGAGLFGAVFAQIMHENGKKCLVIDKRKYPGGNLRCEERDGIRVHSYGAHIFHTDDELIWEYVNRFARFNHYIHSPLANYEGRLYNLPFNMNTFNKLWGVNTPEEAKHKIREQCRPYRKISKPVNLKEFALKTCGEDIYNILIKGYTEKQWGCSASELPDFIIKRIPLRYRYDNNYFDDRYQGIPLDGYNNMIDRLLAGTEVRTNTNYFENRRYFEGLAKKTLFTGRRDEFFDNKFGLLEYRSLRFKNEYIETKDYQGCAVVNYTSVKDRFTRIIEHKHFEFAPPVKHTIITKEYPQRFTGKREPYYPVNTNKNMRLFEKYEKLSESIPNVIFGGRLAQYKYFDMDDTIDAAIKLAQKERSL